MGLSALLVAVASFLPWVVSARNGPPMPRTGVFLCNSYSPFPGLLPGSGEPLSAAYGSAPVSGTLTALVGTALAGVYGVALVAMILAALASNGVALRVATWTSLLALCVLVLFAVWVAYAENAVRPRVGLFVAGGGFALAAVASAAARRIRASAAP